MINCSLVLCRHVHVCCRYRKHELFLCLCPRLRDELSALVSDVGEWWGTCEGVREWVSESMGEMARERPLAGSEDIVAQQLSRVQVHDCLYYTV